MNRLLQRQPASARSHAAPPTVNAVLRSPGRPLDAKTRAYFEPRFGHDFSNVRVHAGAEAARSARALKAQAYTFGQDVVFGAGRFKPETLEGRRLLAHELTHVAQQSRDASPPAVMRQPENSPTQEFQLTPLTLTPRRSAPRRSTHSRTYSLIAFDTDSAALTQTHEVILRQLAAELNAHPLVFGGFISIWGFADSRGSSAHNRRLGQRRADAVRDRLLQLLTDPQTRQQIHAMSAGEDLNVRGGNVPEYRKVEITVVRRGIDFRFSPSSSTGILSAPTPPISAELPEGLRVPLAPRQPRIPEIGAAQSPPLPPWFWQTISPVSRPHVDLHALSEALTDGLRQPLAAHTADIASRLAGVVGIHANRDQIRRSLDQAMISGGEAGLRRLLQMMIFAIAGPPTPPQPSPYGPPSSTFSAPGEHIFSGPTFHF